MKRLVMPLSLFAVFFLFGCQKAYYSAMEQVGYEKREILSDRVENARESQQEAKEQFASALDRYKSVVRFDGGDLEEKYETLNDEYETSEARAEDVRNRIASVEDVADALFEEWAEEITQYTNRDLQRSSRAKMAETKTKYAKLLRAMKKASAKMDPVLAAFKDQVLYLKHNLNAQAISALEGELATIQDDVTVLIKEMETSISEADAFIATLK